MPVERSFFDMFSTPISIAIIVIVSINFIAVYFYYFAEFISKPKIIRFVSIIDSIFIISLTTSYFILRPKEPAQRIAILPCEINSNRVDSLYRYLISHQIERNLINQSQDNYLFHSFWWTMQGVNPDVEGNLETHRQLLKTLNSKKIISLQLTEQNQNWVLELQSENFTKRYDLANVEFFYETSKDIISDIAENLDVEINRPIVNYLDKDFIHLNRLFIRNRYDSIVNFYTRDMQKALGFQSQLVIGRAYTQIAYSLFQRSNTESNYSAKPYLKFFASAQKLIYPLYNQDQYNPDFYPAMIELFLYQENYTDADVLIKAYLVDFGKRDYIRKSNPELLYFYSFLMESRIKQDGYLSREDLLKECITINPLFDRAYQRLGKLAFQNLLLNSEQMDGIISVFENYVSLNPYSDSAKFTLGAIYNQRGDILKAYRLYQRMMNQGINTPDLRYNLAICHYYFAKDFSKYSKYSGQDSLTEKTSRTIAIQYFSELAERDDFKDAHLFLGSMYMDKQENEKAVYHFRQRVKVNFGDNDFYYKEAMKGLRKIFEKDTLLLRKYAKELDLLNE